jgi:methionyl aminopeptidase
MPANPVCIFEESQYDMIREAGRLAGEILHLVGDKLKPGVTPLEVDEFAEQWIRDKGHVPTFKGYMDFPNTLCISVNENIVHGIPNERPFKDGDVVSIDVGVSVTEKHKGEDFIYVGDNAFTFPVGEPSSKVKKLLTATNKGLWAGVDQIKAGAMISDISKAVEEVCKEYRYGNVKDFGGHGVGQNYHCEPFIPNYSDFFKHYGDYEIKEGMVLCVEPMFNVGVSEISKHKDGWTITTADRKPSAHFEHEVLVKKDGIEVITDVRNTRDWSAN